MSRCRGGWGDFGDDGQAEAAPPVRDRGAVQADEPVERGRARTAGCPGRGGDWSTTVSPTSARPRLISDRAWRAALPVRLQSSGGAARHRKPDHPIRRPSRRRVRLPSATDGATHAVDGRRVTPPATIAAVWRACLNKRHQSRRLACA